jgi:hypothetical protein
MKTLCLQGALDTPRGNASGTRICEYSRVSFHNSARSLLGLPPIEGTSAGRVIQLALGWEVDP